MTVKDPEGFAAEQKEQVNQFLYLIYGLLGLSVIIAILGVINTLSLSVIERTREIGLLRAVGVTRRQLRTMIRLESVVVAVLGGVLGTVLGVLFGATHGDRAGGGRPDRSRHPVAAAGRLPAPGGGRGSARCGTPGASSGPTGRVEGHRDRVIRRRNPAGGVSLKARNLGPLLPHWPVGPDRFLVTTLEGAHRWTSTRREAEAGAGASTCLSASTSDR